MKRCLDLAQPGAGAVSPNPLVGSVIVCDDRIIGEGWHQQYGGPHGEVNAVASVVNPELLKTSTLYVNLEPCSHFGQTPPCADLIISHQIPRVVIATVDDHSAVAGQGIQRLRDHGVDVTVGILEQEARFLNRAFFCYHQKKRPYVHLKWARSRDGYMAPDEGQQWISNAYTKRLTHRWRRDYDSILVGRRTTLLDDPNLNDRYWGSPPIQRIIIDPERSLPRDLQVFTDGRPTLVINRIVESVDEHTAYIVPKNEAFDAATLLDTLYDRAIQSVIVEGGAITLQHFIDANYWDEATIYQSEHDLEGGVKAPDWNLSPDQSVNLGKDSILQYYNV